MAPDPGGLLFLLGGTDDGVLACVPRQTAEAATTAGPALAGVPALPANVNGTAARW